MIWKLPVAGLRCPLRVAPGPWWLRRLSRTHCFWWWMLRGCSPGQAAPPTSSSSDKAPTRPLQHVAKESLRPAWVQGLSCKAPHHPESEHRLLRLGPAASGLHLPSPAPRNPPRPSVSPGPRLSPSWKPQLHIPEPGLLSVQARLSTFVLQRARQ